MYKRKLNLVTIFNPTPCAFKVNHLKPVTVLYFIHATAARACVLANAIYRIDGII